MKPIKIITDSLADIPKELVEKYDIAVLPLTIRFGEEEFKDGIDLNAQEFFVKLQESNELPGTSQVPPNVFLDEMKDAVKNGYQTIIINGSSAVSGTYHSAIMAKNELAHEDITVIDTSALSYSCGMIVVEAAKMARKGKTKQDILHRIEEMKERIDHIFSVETLDYLKKGGRLSATKATIGKILNVKPILIIDDGKVELFDKVRGSKKIIPKMIELAKQRGLKRGSAYVCIAHGANRAGLQKLKEAVMDAFEPKKLIETEIGCTIGTYTGPGMLAILYMKGE
ncbi:DegV family protein [Marinisporobacter balticus]|uniref:DegV family protein with EDD domain n=1 Tax=Marinisporobacter balticus TaxID=2018667 RepID=A0A4R2L693_9FIRM|nr:DegV family protein [Marinisporobacter balticus]TCO79476.1 DegV family protein with EDD domain [Marinisporobacter balticus]